MENLPIAISFIAVVIALWQGYLAKSQLEEAKRTKEDTEKLLDSIKEKVTRIETISDETRKDVKEQVSKLVDKQDENFKMLLNTPKENNQNEMVMKLLPMLAGNPDVLKMMVDLGQQQKK